jgi:hypothetical protein
MPVERVTRATKLGRIEPDRWLDTCDRCISFSMVSDPTLRRRFLSEASRRWASRRQLLKSKSKRAALGSTTVLPMAGSTKGA